MRHRCEDSRSASVRCPFFRGHTSREIGCEGVVHSSSVRMLFPSQARRDHHEDVYCCSNYSYCPLFGPIWRKYEEDDP